MAIPRLLLSVSPDRFNSYAEALKEAGAQSVGGYCPAPDLTCDGLVLCGGGDVEPSLYGQENHGSFPPEPGRDHAEEQLFRAFLQAGKPILGICRGMQYINVLLGGTLIQDLPKDIAPFHGGVKYDLIHPIRTREGSLLHTLYGATFPVNSYHHQAVDVLGEGLEATAWAEGGFPEAFEHRSLPILAVQFHPERLSCGFRRQDAVDGIPFLRHFVSLCQPR